MPAAFVSWIMAISTAIAAARTMASITISRFSIAFIYLFSSLLKPFGLDLRCFFICTSLIGLKTAPIPCSGATLNAPELFVYRTPFCVVIVGALLIRLL